MSTAHVNGVTLWTETQGTSGSPVVLVHGSWGDHHNWDLVAPRLAETHTVVTYDRRGHSQSERPASPGSVHEDVADLAALIETTGIGPAHVVGNSAGAIISLRLAADRPELIRSLVVHDPPLLGVIADDPALAAIVAAFNEGANGALERLNAGDMAGGAQRFVEDVAFGPGAWDQFPPPAKETFVANAPTWLDEMNDPDFLTLDLTTLESFDHPALVTQGDQSPPMFSPIVDRVAGALPDVVRHTFTGAGHVPHMSHPDDYVQRVLSFIA